MGYSNSRIKEPLTAHHIVNRIAHRVFFLHDDEKNDILGMMRRAAEFTGVKLVGWCIMTNHFHILAFLPDRTDLDEAEIIRRVGVLKGQAGADALASRLAELRRKSAAQKSSGAGNDAGEEKAQEILTRLRTRMYGISSFMKILKQWFTEEYNRRSAHVGTLWESTYIDRAVPCRKARLANVLAYICLNPVRAGVCADFDTYAWSSLYAALAGDSVAIDGLRFVYGDDMDLTSTIEALHIRMDTLLEQEKRDWANEVARRRRAGYAVPDNPLTDEAYVAQAAAHLDEVVQAGMSLVAPSRVYEKCLDRRREIMAEAIEALRQDPTLSPAKLAKILKQPTTTTYRYMKCLIDDGILKKDGRPSRWTINESRIMSPRRD